MIINHTYKFVFVHIPKAAGTSATATLSPMTQYCDQEIGGTQSGESVQRYYSQRFGLRKHSIGADIRSVMGHQDWSRYFTFSFVRNPFSRLMSAFYFLKHWDGVPEKFQADFSKIDDFATFMKSDLWVERGGPDNIFRPQTTWVYESGLKGGLIVDYVGKVENMYKDFETIGKNIGIRKSSLKTKISNITPKYDKNYSWSDQDIEKLLRHYECDFKNFSYEMTPPE